MKGKVELGLAYTCCRCLAKNERLLQAELDLTFLPLARYRSESTGNKEVELTEEDLDISFYEGDEIDLKDVIREAILLEVEAYPSCPDACPEAERFVSTAEDNEEEFIDPRWAPLKALQRKARS